MKKIVFTGGPCAGKTTILDFFAKLNPDDYLVVPEAATIILKGGFYPSGLDDDEDRVRWQIDFQKAVVRLQESLESFGLYKANKEAKKYILCDSGLFSGAAYFPGGFEKFCRDTEIDINKVMADYDAVVHLESLAVGQPKRYGQYNNTSRFHNLEESRKIDKLLKNIWGIHRNHFVIDSRMDLDRKIENIKIIINKVINL